jgi:hypothetical protein
MVQVKKKENKIVKRIPAPRVMLGIALRNIMIYEDFTGVKYGRDIP